MPVSLHTYQNIVSLGLSSFYSELMKGLGAGGRLWELIERKPELPFNGMVCSLFLKCCTIIW